MSRWRRFARGSPVLFEARRSEVLHPILRSYLDGIPLCLYSEPGRWLRLLWTSRRRFERELQRPQSFYAPHLHGEPFPEANATSRLLEQHAEEIVAEWSRLGSEVGSRSKALLSGGDWNTFPLARAARRFPENIKRCPVTWEVVEACPRPPKGVRGGVYFSILDPGTHITPHCGPSNLKHRYHLTIVASEAARIRSGDQWRSWSAGKCLILDDSFEHEVVYDGDARRVVLIVDCWHDSLGDEEKQFLTDLHRRF